MLKCFKKYDIRGRLGQDLNDALAMRIGHAFGQVLDAGPIVLGHDIRSSSPGLADALAEGLVQTGRDVIEIGLCGTEEVYFATDHLGAGGGLMVTASHNPIEYNGIKVVNSASRPLTWEDGLGQVHDLADAGSFVPAGSPGQRRQADVREAYVDKVLSFVNAQAFAPLRVVVNSGNGTAGPTLDALAPHLGRLDFQRVNHDPDPAFPNGIPNPLLPENQPVTSGAVRAAGADLGVAWDGDHDRCFLFDETGTFVEGEYIVALLARVMLRKRPGSTIVHDPRVIWAVSETVASAGGTCALSPTGHSLMKSRMREVNAVYGGELSAHHYFREFMYCDSGMIPWLLVAEEMSTTGKPLSELVGALRAAYPSSGEVNFRVRDVPEALEEFAAKYGPEAGSRDDIDGINLIFADGWRASVRASNTEPLLRLNVEARGDNALLAAKVAEITGFLARFEAEA